MQHPRSYQNDIRRTIGVLQQWQILLAPLCASSVTEVTLADVQARLEAWLETFGPTATLEALIQYFVGQDLRQQIEEREEREHLTGAAA